MKHLCFLFIFFNVSWAAPGLNAVPSKPAIKIVGGDDADIKDFPYIGALLFDGQQGCGAALISKDTVVTAAHCVYYYRSNIRSLSFRFGSSEWRSGGQEISVKQVIIHERYDELTTDYDVAVVQLTESVNVPNAIPIVLADGSRKYPDGTLGVVSGWGLTSQDGVASSETLRKVEVPVVEESRCRVAYGNIISNRTICAGYQEGGKDACSRDSGGPYVINGELAGIVSFGAGCALPSYPGVYASVPTFNYWIKSHAGI